LALKSPKKAPSLNQVENPPKNSNKEQKNPKDEILTKH